MTPARVMVSKVVNRLLVPHLLAMGFVIRGNEDGKGWREGRSFDRERNGRGQAAFLGRHKFGNVLGLLLARERPDGSYEYLDVKQAVGREALRYETQQELEDVIGRLRQYLEGEGSHWLDGAL